MPKLKRKTIIIFILAVLGLYLIVEVIPPLTGALASTEILEYGRLKVSDKQECWILRDETVYKADKTGTIKVFAGEGTLLKKGTRIMDFSEKPVKKGKKEEGSSAYKEMVSRMGDAMVAEKDQKSDRKGLFSFYVDGYESFLSPKKMKELTESELKQIKEAPESLERTEVIKGDPIFKIADNSRWYIMCWIDEGKIGRYEKDKAVKVKLPGDTIDAKVYQVNEAGGKWQLILSTNRYYKDFLTKRSFDAEIITTDMEGLLISNDCLAMKDKKVGCYVRSTSGDYVFKEVQTQATDGEKTLVTETEFFDKKGRPVSTVKAYDEVKRDPDSDD